MRIWKGQSRGTANEELVFTAREGTPITELLQTGNQVRPADRTEFVTHDFSSTRKSSGNFADFEVDTVHRGDRIVSRDAEKQPVLKRGF